MCCGAVQLTPSAFIPGIVNAATTASSMASPAQVCVPDRQPNEHHDDNVANGSSASATARASAALGIVSIASRSGAEATSTRRRSRWKATSARWPMA